MIEKLMKFYKERESFKVKEASSKKKIKKKDDEDNELFAFFKKEYDK